jgi:hypothetical protein
MGTSKHIDDSAAFLFEVPGSNSPLALQELQIGGTGARFPKFVFRCSTRFNELRKVKVMGTDKSMVLVPLRSEIPGTNQPLVTQGRQIGGTSPMTCRCGGR